jgi:hypothetical protein
MLKPPGVRARIVTASCDLRLGTVADLPALRFVDPLLRADHDWAHLVQSSVEKRVLDRRRSGRGAGLRTLGRASTSFSSVWSDGGRDRTASCPADQTTPVAGEGRIWLSWDRVMIDAKRRRVAAVVVPGGEVSLQCAEGWAMTSGPSPVDKARAMRRQMKPSRARKQSPIGWKARQRKS